MDKSEVISETTSSIAFFKESLFVFFFYHTTDIAPGYH